MEKLKRLYIQTGDLRERITFQFQTNVVDLDGTTLTNWQNLPINHTVWARVEPNSSKEFIIGGRSQTRRRWSCTIRDRTDISMNMRVSWRGIFFDIVGIDNIGERNKYILLDLIHNNLVIA
jgi:SPP1 family predicted phage head-tail adaptor